MNKQYEHTYICPKVCCNLEWNRQKTQKPLTAMKRTRKNADNDCQRGNMCKRRHSVNIPWKSKHLFPLCFSLLFCFFCIATMKNCGNVREHITNRVSIFIIETVLLIGRRRLWYCELYIAASNLSAHKGVLLRISFHLWKSIHKNEQKIFVCDNFIFCT